MRKTQIYSLAFGLLFCICLAALLLQLLQMPDKYRQALNQAFEREMVMVQTMVGAIVAEHSEYEKEISEILRDGSEELSVQDIAGYSALQKVWRERGFMIPKEERSRIFQRFYRGQDALVRAAEGSGVGLFLSRYILEQQGGSIAVQDRIEGGSTFILQLR